MSPLAATPYQQLISAIADEEPITGWSGGPDLPALTRQDVQVVLAHRPQDVLDELTLEPLELQAAYAGSNVIGALGMRLSAAVERAARDAIWHDVAQECDQRDIDRERERADGRRGLSLARYEAGVPKELL